jgi:hypothetical protein
MRGVKQLGCEVEGCENEHYALSLCKMHWWRVRRTGEVGPAGHMYALRPSGQDPLWSQIAPTGFCWEWTGRTDQGYGRVSIGGRQLRAHRVVYERLVGRVPDGLVLDHLCRNRGCVNPDHLEPVTNEENIRRGVAIRKLGLAA